MLENNAHTIFRKNLRVSVRQRTKITSCLRFWALGLLALSLSACGVVHNTVITQPGNIGVFKEVTLIPPEVRSDKQDVDTIALNEELKKMASDELQSLLESKNIVLSDNRKASIECHINVDYGNRASRYLVGFGAGAGHMSVRIVMKDDKGVTRSATSSEADLAMGFLGGDMMRVAREAISKAVRNFGSKL